MIMVSLDQGLSETSLNQDDKEEESQKTSDLTTCIFAPKDSAWDCWDESKLLSSVIKVHFSIKVQSKIFSQVKN